MKKECIYTAYQKSRRIAQSFRNHSNSFCAKFKRYVCIQLDIHQTMEMQIPARGPLPSRREEETLQTLLSASEMQR